MTERVVEIPWVLEQLPATGVILDIGSREATYLFDIPKPGRFLHCLDPNECGPDIPPEAVFHHQSLIGNDLPEGGYDAVLMVSVLEHIGLPCYQQRAFPDGDRLALGEVWRLLKPGGKFVATVPAGQGKIVSWYRQYSPEGLRRLFDQWDATFTFWGFDGSDYRPIREKDVRRHDYRDHPYVAGAGAGAVAGILAHRARRRFRPDSAFGRLRSKFLSWHRQIDANRY